MARLYTIPQGEEQALAISIRDFDRLIERLDGCKPGGWGELWLAGVGAGVTLAVAALVGALTLPANSTAIRDVLWAVMAAGGVFLLLCLMGYFTQRRDRSWEISELKKDLEMRKPGTACSQNRSKAYDLGGMPTG